MIYNVTINDKVYEVEVEKGKANLIRTTAVQAAPAPAAAAPVAAAPAAAPAPAAPAAPVAAPAAAAPVSDEMFSSGSLKLKNCDEKTAAMIMAIVADDTGIPLNELVFKSIKLVEKK